MKLFKKLLAMLMVFLMFISCLTACSVFEDAKQEPERSSAEINDESEDEISQSKEPEFEAEESDAPPEETEVPSVEVLPTSTEDTKETDDETDKKEEAVPQEFPKKAIQLKDGKEYKYDIDGDGELERICFNELEADDWEYIGRILVTENSGKTAKFELEYNSGAFAYLADIDGKGNKLHVILSADLASSDYASYFIEYDGEKSELFNLKVRPRKNSEELYEALYGDFKSGVSDENRVKFEIIMDSLGTWLTTREYEYIDGIIEPCGDSWMINLKLYPERLLKSTTEIPVTLQDGSEGFIGTGVQLRLFRLTDDYKVYFETVDGSLEGYIQIEKADDGYSWNINGISEYEYFEELHYSG